MESFKQLISGQIPTERIEPLFVENIKFLMKNVPKKYGNIKQNVHYGVCKKQLFILKTTPLWESVNMMVRRIFAKFEFISPSRLYRI